MNLQRRNEPKGVLDFGELGQEKVHAKPQENQHKKVTSEFLFRRNWQSTFGIHCRGSFLYSMTARRQIVFRFNGNRVLGGSSCQIVAWDDRVRHLALKRNITNAGR